MALLHDLLHLAHPGVGHLAAHLEAARDAGDVDRLDDGAAVLDVDRQGRGEIEYALLEQAQDLGSLEVHLGHRLDAALEAAAGSLRQLLGPEGHLEVLPRREEVPRADDVELLLVELLRLNAAAESNSAGQQGCGENRSHENPPDAPSVGVSSATIP